MKQNKTLIMIPTYNERENVPQMFQQISELNLDADLLFVDDNSPDGTGDIIDDIIKDVDSAHALHRPGKQGIGSAHFEGIQWAYGHNYQQLVTMDCDFTHSPSDIKEFLKHAESNDIVVGSRYMDDESLSDWNLLRKFLTYFAHFLTTALLRMTLDATGAFRCYRLDRVPLGCFELIKSKGYSFFFESLFVMVSNKFLIKEIPIKLPARTCGHSKMTLKDAFSSLKFLMELYLTKLFKPASLIYNKPQDYLSLF